MYVCIYLIYLLQYCTSMRIYDVLPNNDDDLSLKMNFETRALYINHNCFLARDV